MNLAIPFGWDWYRFLRFWGLREFRDFTLLKPKQDFVDFESQLRQLRFLFQEVGFEKCRRQFSGRSCNWRS